MSTRLEIRIRADKSGPEPKAGVPWPLKGVELIGHTLDGDDTLYPGPPAAFDFPTGWVRNELARGGWVTLENMKFLERPSQPNPAIVKGSAAVAPEHHLAIDPPHKFIHADCIVLDTLNHGVLRYKVVGQPDKYADNSVQDARGRTVQESEHTDETTVSREIYDAGETRVDHFYRCVLEG